jgi:hypothetical protein
MPRSGEARALGDKLRHLHDQGGGSVGILRRADGESRDGLQRVPGAKREGRLFRPTSGAPVWKVIQLRSASVSWDGARCSGVVPSQSVRISAPGGG